MPLSSVAPSFSPPSSVPTAPAASAETPRIDGLMPSTQSTSAASASTASAGETSREASRESTRESTRESSRESGRSLSDSSLSLGSAILGRRAEEELAHELLRSRRARGSYTVSLAALLVCLLSLPFCMYVGIHFQADHGLALLVLTMAAAAYEGVMLLLFRSGRHRPWLDWVNVTLEVTVVSGVVLLDARFLGPAYAFTSAPLLLYGPVVLLSALRLSRTLTIYAGVLAGVQLLCAYAAYAPLLDPQVVRLVPSLTTANMVQRASYLASTGLLASWLCSTFVTALQEFIEMVRRELRTRNTLGRHVSREVARHLLAHSQDGGQQRHLSVLFCDVRGFTTFSESLDPGDVLNFLNQFCPLANRIVEAHGGIINKFLGDGFMALFGATTAMPQREHARCAAQTALALVGGLDELRRTWKWPELRIGVGVHSGVAVVGLVGSVDRVEFTAIGDTVNLASRIESMCKTYDVQLLVSNDTARLLGPAAHTRRLGETPVRGRRAPAEVHELLGLEPAAPPDCVTPPSQRREPASPVPR